MTTQTQRKKIYNERLLRLCLMFSCLCYSIFSYSQNSVVLTDPESIGRGKVNDSIFNEQNRIVHSNDDKTILFISDKSIIVGELFFSPNIVVKHGEQKDSQIKLYHKNDSQYLSKNITKKETGAEEKAKENTENISKKHAHLLRFTKDKSTSFTLSNNLLFAASVPSSNFKKNSTKEAILELNFVLEIFYLEKSSKEIVINIISNNYCYYYHRGPPLS